MIETLTLADLCQPGSTLAVSPDDRVGRTLAIMAEQQLSAVVVAVDGCPVGIFTERDVLGLMARGDYDPEARLCDLMTPDPVTVSPQLTFAAGYARMAGHGFRHLVLADGQGRLYGVLSETDFARALGAEELMGPRTVADLMTRNPATFQDRTQEHADTERLRAIFDHSPAGIALGDIQGRLVLANPALYEILGYREHPQELVGRHFSDLTLPEDRAGDIAQFARLQAGELPSYRIEKQYLRRDGTTARVEVTVSAIRDLSGRMTASLAIVNDISALRLAQEHLLEAQAIAHVGSWELDIADGTMIWSDETYRLLGYTPGEVEANEERLLAAMPAADRAARAAALTAALASPDGHYRLEHRVQGVDGVPHILLAEGRIARDAQGRPMRLTGTSLDVTRQRATEAALRAEQTRLAAQRRRLANIIAGTRVGTWEWEVQTGATVFNARWAEIAGYRLEELAPTTIETWIRLAHPEDLPISNALLQRHFRGELDTYECEVRVRHKDGHWVWVFDQGRVVSWGPAGEPLLMSGIHQDISERHRAQERLRESEARLRAVFDNAPLGMALVGADGRVTLANQALGTFLGCAPERAVGMPVYGMSPPQERRADRIILADLIAGRRTSYRATKRYRRVDGREVWGDLRVTLLPNRPGEPPSPLGMVEDVTELYAANAQRQALEDALGRYTLQLEELVDVANLPLALPEQVCALLSLGCRSLGMTAALLGQLDSGHRALATVRVDDPDGQLPRLGRRALDDILGGQGQPRVLGPERLTRSTVAAGFVSCIGVAFDCPRPDGPSDTLILTLWSTEPPLNLGGPERQILRLVAQRAAAVYHNERLQRSLIQAKERETIGHLASGVAHDFNNLLGVIDANLFYLENRLQDRITDPELVQVLDEIQSALGQAKVVTSGMLSLSRAGGVPLESVDLASTVADLVRILIHLLPPAIQLTVQIPADLKTRSNRGFLQAALLNLALNARDAMPNGGQLRIAAQPGPWDAGARLAVGRLPAGDGVELSVTDTGTGMHPEILARIFEPLFSTKAKQRGHGLGLFMVQEFVSRSGAGLTVNSSPGEGTRFSLLLPPAGDAVADTAATR